MKKPQVHAHTVPNNTLYSVISCMNKKQIKNKLLSCGKLFLESNPTFKFGNYHFLATISVYSTAPSPYAGNAM